MSAVIHPTAVVDPGAELDEGVTIGAVRRHRGRRRPRRAVTRSGDHASLQGPAVFGEENRIFPHAALGFDPQDLKYRGEPTRLSVGARNVFREFTTVHRGTRATARP